MSSTELFRKHFGEELAAVDLKHPNMEAFFEELNQECLEEDRIKNCKHEMETIKDELKKEYEKVWTTKKGIDEKMINYCMDKIALYLKTEDGYFYILEKEKLNTQFWISEGSNRSMEEALNICDEIKTKEDFFIDENLSKINYLINTIKNNKNNLFFAERFKNSKIVSITTTQYNLFNKENRKLTPDEEAGVLKLCEKFKELQTKKINSYLKRYGLSKIQANTYWFDR